MMGKPRSFRMHVCLLILLATCSLAAFGAPRGALQVGAARIDITPAPDAALLMGGYGGRTQGFQRIHDHIYVRAIVLSDGTRQAVLLGWEHIFMPTHVWEVLSHRITKELGIPGENLILAAVHDHSAPTLAETSGSNAPDGARTGANPAG